MQAKKTLLWSELSAMHHGNGNQFGMWSKTKTPSYLCVHHCPWNSGCNCLQRSLYQPRKDWRQNDYNKESVKRGQTWLAATFEKWYTQISVGLDFPVPCQHTGMVPPPKMCKDEHTKSTNAHTRKHTTSCAKPWRQDNPAFTPLHAHLAFVFFPSFHSSPDPHWDVHICSYFGLWKGSPPCPEAPTSNPRFPKNVPKRGHF